MKIIFKVYCPNSRDGEILKVVGNVPELGYWNPMHAFSLVTSKDKYPFWEGGVFIDKCSINEWQNIEFKYVLCKHDSTYWETYVQNRILEVNKDSANLCHVFNDNQDLFVEGNMFNEPITDSLTTNSQN